MAGRPVIDVTRYHCFLLTVGEAYVHSPLEDVAPMRALAQVVWQARECGGEVHSFGKLHEGDCGVPPSHRTDADTIAFHQNG
jgi:hypothetical protein